MTKPTIVIALVVAALALGLGSFVIIRQHTGAASPAPQPRTTIVVEESSGGTETLHGRTEGARLGLQGDKVSAEDLKLTATVIDFTGIGQITGGALAGSFKVSAGTLRILQWLCALLAVGCVISATIKYTKGDMLHCAGQAACAMGLFLAVLNTDLLGWFGLGAIAIQLVSGWFPSASSNAEAAMGKLLDRIEPTARAHAIDKMPPGKLKVAVVKAEEKRSRT